MAFSTTFVGLFALSRSVQRREGERLSAQSNLVNAVELLEEAARHRLDESERRRALALLRDADSAEPLVAQLRSLFRNLNVQPAPAPGRAARDVRAVRQAWARLATWPRFATCVSWLMGIWAAVSLLGIVELVTGAIVDLGGAHPGYRSDRLGDLAFVNMASLASSALSAALVARGVVELRHGRRMAAYRVSSTRRSCRSWSRKCLLFVESQFGAVFGLALDLLLLVALRAVKSNDPAAKEAVVRTPREVARPLQPVSAGP